ncbi:MAG: hypothetical protein WC455_27970 [Dehalococcoidia bacterium]
MRHETEAFTINEILDIYPKLQWFTDNNYEQKADACTLRETIIEMARNKYHAPQHAIANVSTGDGGVLVELFWLEAQE